MGSLPVPGSMQANSLTAVLWALGIMDGEGFIFALLQFGQSPGIASR